MNDIKYADLQIQQTTQPKEKLPKEKLLFGKTFTDHMFEVDWNTETGWGTPYIRPYGPLTIDPASASLHYGVSCFEGMKAYRDENDNVRFFRPDMNMKRLKASTKRIYLGDFNEHELLKCLKKLVALDKDWIPKGDGYSLYIRPTVISTHPYLGVGPSISAKLFIILSPVGPYYANGFNPIRLATNKNYVRAWPGGTGAYKLGVNYTAGIKHQASAAKEGYSQILGLYGPDDELTEVGTMNLFVYWINEQGEKELLTPPLTRGDILPGVTRDSVLALAREWKQCQVTEANITMKQIQKAEEDGRLLEIFGTGTGAVISPVSCIHYEGKDIQVPLTGKDGKIGEVAEQIWNELLDIHYGRKAHSWSIVIE